MEALISLPKVPMAGTSVNQDDNLRFVHATDGDNFQAPGLDAPVDTLADDHRSCDAAIEDREAPEQRRSIRIKKKLSWLEEYINNVNCRFTNAVITHLPSTFPFVFSPKLNTEDANVLANIIMLQEPKSYK